jgi:perosamine synthetase
MHQQPALIKLGAISDYNFPISEKMYNKGFYIPSGLGLSVENSIRVANAIKNVLL